MDKSDVFTWYLVSFFQPQPQIFQHPSDHHPHCHGTKMMKDNIKHPPKIAHRLREMPILVYIYRALCVLCTGHRKQPVSNECVVKQPVQRHGNGNTAIKQPLLNTVDVAGSRKYSSKHKPPCVFNIAPCSLYLCEICFLLKLEARSWKSTLQHELENPFQNLLKLGFRGLFNTWITKAHDHNS